MTVDITPEAVERLALDYEFRGKHGKVSTLRALSAAIGDTK